MGDVSRLHIKAGAPGPLGEGRVPSTTSRITAAVPGLQQPRLPFEVALAQVARAVTNYIAENRLALREAYASYVAEFCAELPISTPADESLAFVEKFATALLSRLAENADTVSGSALGLSGEFRVGGNTIRLDAADTLQKVVEKVIAHGRRFQPLLTADGLDIPQRRTYSTDFPRPHLQRIVAGWRLDGGLISRLDHNFASGLSVQDTRGLGPMAVAQEFTESQSARQMGEGIGGSGASSAGRLIGSLNPSASLPADGSGTSTDIAGSIKGTPDRLRINLAALFGGSAELTVRYDAAVITSKVAVLLEEVNSLVRAAQAGRGREGVPTGRAPNTSLEKAIDAIFSLVISQNNSLRDVASLGIGMTRQKLLTLDPTMLKAALETNREEAVTVLRALAGTLQERIGLYVDPRLANAAVVPARGQTPAERTRNKARKNRWEKDRGSLEKRMLELRMLFEYSKGLHAWFQNAVDILKPDETSAGASLVPLGTMLPVEEKSGPEMKDLLPSASAEGAFHRFVRLTRASLDAEKSESCVKLLLERKAFVETFRDAEVPVGLDVAELCLKNEEAVLGRLEEERKKLLVELEELSRNMQAAKEYAPHFPFPPMPAFVSSAG